MKVEWAIGERQAGRQALSVSPVSTPTGICNAPCSTVVKILLFNDWRERDACTRSDKHTIRCLAPYVFLVVYLGSSWRWRGGSVICPRDRGLSWTVFFHKAISHPNLFFFEEEACRFAVALSPCRRLWIPARRGQRSRTTSCVFVLMVTC